MRYDAGEVITAMVTPFNEKREVDYEKVEQLAYQLINTGSDAVLVTGTTGESPTLTHEEEIEILCSAKRGVGANGKVIMGTETAVMMAKKAEKEGVDAILSVVPYYNKPSQSGIIEHFSAVAEAVELPVILYNIPSRTGVNMSVDTVKTLARKYENIVDLITDLKMNCPKDFTIYSGDDSLTLPMLSVGAHGVISVASHLFGKEIKSMIRNFKTGDVLTARNMHQKLYPIFKKLFMAPNPVPVKAALAYKEIINDYVRRPLVELTKSEKAELIFTLDSI